MPEVTKQTNDMANPMDGINAKGIFKDVEANHPTFPNRGRRMAQNMWSEGVSETY